MRAARACSADNNRVNSFSRPVRGRTRRALLILLPTAAAVAALLSVMTLGVTAAEAGVVIAAAAGLWVWLGTVRTRVEESRLLALTDDLTGLGNRRRLLGDLERAIGEGTDHSPSVLAMFDLDGFKAYNDTHGHPAGDALWRGSARGSRRHSTRRVPRTGWAATSSACFSTARRPSSSTPWRPRWAL